ncbi:MAG: YecA family protein [Acidimicrobiales bacterium]
MTAPTIPVRPTTRTWYASDRGDAAEAARLLERAGDDDGIRVAFLRQLSDQAGPPAHVGRNEPCPCGSGRKYKQCCLARPAGVASPPLERRVRWLWEKMRWWLERFGPMDTVLTMAFVLGGTRPRAPSIEHAVDLDVAASLVLFADGAVTDFLAQRGPLLPVEEANLVAQWSLRGPSVHEVGRVREGVGLDLRDLRSGDVVDMVERSGSRSLRDGDLVFAHPVFDGTGYQIVGGIVPVTMEQRGPLMALLDEEEGAFAVADELARQEEGQWAQMLERDGREVVRANASIEGETLALWANSEVRFGRVKETVAGALGPLDVVEETRETIEDAARLDEPVPALGGLTPRQAADDPTRREDLLALLHEYERMAVPEGAVSYDVSRLRELLGLRGT